MRYLIVCLSVFVLLLGCASKMPYKEAKGKSWFLIQDNAPEGCLYADGEYDCADKNVEEYLNFYGPKEDDVIPLIEDRVASPDEAQWLIRKLYRCYVDGDVTVCDFPLRPDVLNKVNGEEQRTVKAGEYRYKFLN